MALELPGWVVTAFWLVGLPWPGIDEDELRAWATSVRHFASGIEASSARTGRLTAGLAGSSKSSFTDTLAGHWEQHHKTISSMRGPMDAFADALDAAADAVVVQKGVVIGAAITLAGEFVATQAEAFFTFGAAEAEVPVEVAITREIVKLALQDLEAELIGKLINVAAADITAHLNATIRRLLGGAVSVTFEAASLKIDLATLRRAAATARSQAADTDEAGTDAYTENAGRDLEDPGAGGRWAIVQLVEQALLSIATDLFKTLPHTLSIIQDDTAANLDDAATTIENTDHDLSGHVPHPDTAGDADSQPAAPEVRPLPSPAEAGQIIKDATAVGSALKSDPWHAAGVFVRDEIADNGSVFTTVGGDGVERLLVQMPGEVNDVAGRFEWIVDGDRLTHQFFVRGGTINGIPIKP